MTAGDALGTKACGVPAGHSSANALPVALTLSLKLMTRGASSATVTSVLAGAVLATLGAASAGGATVVNGKLALPAIWSGAPSVSVISLATTVTVHVVAKGRAADGVSVIVLVPEPLCVKVFVVPAGHSSVNEPLVVVTFSLKLTTMVESAATLVAPFAGVVLLTLGAISPAGIPVMLMLSTARACAFVNVLPFETE